MSDDGHPEASGGSRVGHTPELGSNFYPKWNLIWACLLLNQNPLHTSQHPSVYLPSLTELLEGRGRVLHWGSLH